jgi:hypothetical protein
MKASYQAYVQIIQIFFFLIIKVIHAWYEKKKNQTEQSQMKSKVSLLLSPYPIPALGSV